MGIHLRLKPPRRTREQILQKRLDFYHAVYPLPAIRAAHTQMTKISTVRIVISQKISTVRFAAFACAIAIRSSGEISSSAVSPDGMLTIESHHRYTVNYAAIKPE